MSAIDEKALERAMIAYRTGEYDRAHAPGPLQDVSVSVRAAIEAYLSATKDAQAERVRVLEEALRQIQDWPMHGNLTDNEDNISIEDMPHYVAGRAYAVIALIQNYARNSIARAALNATGAA